jgi:O-antigen/teichoic acid export membrane protein
MQLMGSYFLNVMAQAVGRVFTFGANFAVFILVARICGADFFGQYSYVLAFLSMFALIADFGMNTVLGRDIAQVGDGASLYWGNFLMLRGVFALVAMAGGLFTAYLMRPDLYSCLVIGILGLPFLASRFFDPVFQVYGRPWFSAILSVIYGASYLALSLAAFVRTNSLHALIAMYVAANVLYCIGAFFLVRKILKPVFVWNQSIVRGILLLAAPLGVSSLFIIICSKAPVFLLAMLVSDRAVGIYNAAYRFFELAVMLAVMLAVPMLPIFSQKAAHDRVALKHGFVAIFETIAVLLIPAAIITPFFSPWVITLCFGAQFVQAAAVLDVLAWVVVLAFYSLLTTNIAVALGVVRFAYWNTAAAAGFSIALNYLLIPMYGPVGSAWTAFLCEIFLCGVTVIYIIRAMGNIFRLQIWMRICVVNIIFAIVLYMPVFAAAHGFRICAALVVYLILGLSLQPLLGDFVQLAHTRILDLASGKPSIEYFVRFIFRVIRYSRYLLSFFYRPQLMLVFETGMQEFRNSTEPDQLPEGYHFGSSAAADFQQWAELLNLDGSMGVWSPERIRDEILPQLIAPEAALLLYHGDRLIGCLCCESCCPPRDGAGMLMWLIIDLQHRGKRLASYLWRRALQCFAVRGYAKVYLQTDSFRHPALQFFLSKGGKPVYDSLSSLLQWWSVRRRLSLPRQASCDVRRTPCD